MHDYHYSARVSQIADLEESIRGSRLRVGKNSVIDYFAKIKFVGGIGDIALGDNCYVNSGSVIYSGDGVSIGDNSLNSPNVVIAATNHEFADSKTLIPLQGLKQTPTGIVIGKDVWIGSGSIILNNTIIEDGCVVAAKPTIIGSLRNNCVYTGNPLRVIGQRF
jgi:acetyltransferase-like isoleucine patch superfamily enzyme